MSQNRPEYSALIKKEAKRLGFMFCGISKAGFFRRRSPQAGNMAKK